MKLKVNPEITRTLIPIYVDVNDVSVLPEIKVTPLDVSNQHLVPFLLNVEKQGDGYKTQFWLEQAGKYELQVTAAGQTLERFIQVNKQEFLPFSKEMGIFSILFFIMGIGVILWNRKATT